jgi:hypothetical protein
MKSRLENILVDCMVDSLRVLLCSECATATTNISLLLSRYPVFSLCKGKTEAGLNDLIMQNNAWECVIIDSRMPFTSALFDTIRKASCWFPVILLTDYVPDVLFQEKGIKQVNGEYVMHSDIDAGDDTDVMNYRKKTITLVPLKCFKDLFSTIRNLCLKKKLMAKMAPCHIGEKAFGFLFSHNPVSVDDWSVLVNEPNRKFQRMVRKYTDHSPKKLITLYHAYRIAFDTMEKQKSQNKGVIQAYMVDDHAKKRVLEYVLSRRSQLLPNR